MVIQLIILILALSALYFGADTTIKSAERIGYFFGLSPLVIGVVIVGFGTSLPELFVSQIAGFRGQSEVSLGNIIGSNIFNMFFILGVSGVLNSFNVSNKEFKTQLNFHLAITLLMGLILIQDNLNLLIGLTLLTFFGFFLFRTHKVMIRERKSIEMEDIPSKDKVSFWEFFKIILGFGLLWIGGDYLVLSVSKIGIILGVSTYFISVVVVAAGTSLPELVTSLMIYFRKKDPELLLGNIIGSNLFNIAFIGGGLGIYNLAIKPKFWMEIIALLLGTLILMFHSIKRIKFSKVGGIIFLFIYSGMLIYWVLVLEKAAF